MPLINHGSLFCTFIEHNEVASCVNWGNGVGQAQMKIPILFIEVGDECFAL